MPRSLAPAPRPRAPARPASAIRRALALLARRPRTESQLRALLARDHHPDDIDRAIERLTEIRYLDDRAWAEAYVSRPRSQQRSARLLRRELRTHGVSDADADAALAGHDDRASALAAATRRVRALRRLDPLTRERRLRSYLARRGFTTDAIASALAALSGADDRFP